MTGGLMRGARSGGLSSARSGSTRQWLFGGLCAVGRLLVSSTNEIARAVLFATDSGWLREIPWVVALSTQNTIHDR